MKFLISFLITLLLFIVCFWIYKRCFILENKKEKTTINFKFPIWFYLLVLITCLIPVINILAIFVFILMILILKEELFENWFYDDKEFLIKRKPRAKRSKNKFERFLIKKF